MERIDLKKHMQNMVREDWAYYVAKGGGLLT